jgi:hypothetical protein
MSSRWWENSPVVIQESYALKIPTLVPSIGGMLENSMPNLTYEVGNSEMLANKIFELAKMDINNYLKLKTTVTASNTDIKEYLRLIK